MEKRTDYYFILDYVFRIGVCCSQRLVFQQAVFGELSKRGKANSVKNQLTGTYEGWGVSHTGQFTAGTHTIDARGAWAGDGDGTCQVYLGGATGSFQSALNLIITQ